MIFLCLNDINRKYLKELEKLGFSGIPASKLVDMAIHKVTIDFIKEAKDLGLKDLSISMIINFKIHGADKEYFESIPNT